MGSNFSKIYSAELEGLDAQLIEVETDIHVGLHNFSIVGLADKALSESKERINSALKNIGIKPPAQENRRITVNLAPADIKKTGAQYDLPIAIGYLVAGGQIKPTNPIGLVVGELALNGDVRPIRGALNIAQCALNKKITQIILPVKNAIEAAIIPGIKIVGIKNLTQAIDYIEGRINIHPQPQTVPIQKTNSLLPRLSEIKGNESAKKALIIAAAGSHNLLMSGPPGTGKTMLAQALISILPKPTLEEIIEITRIYSAAGLLANDPLVTHRPFRSPHQTASIAAIMGGGTNPRPGEISLAHRGILFLDELPEFRRDLLESLRQPLESGVTTVSRVKNNLQFPARFTLVAAMNPCPCGYYQDEEKPCVCAMSQILRYQKKVSGPLLDRIDLQIFIPRAKLLELESPTLPSSTDKQIQIQINKARLHQTLRFKNINKTRNQLIYTNSEMSSKLVDELVILTTPAKEYIRSIFDKAFISARGYYRILKIARTIADLEEKEIVSLSNIKEAFSYRLRESNT